MNKSDKHQITSADRVVKQIDKLYRNIIAQVVSLTNEINFDDPTSVFYFANFPKIKKQIDKLLNVHSEKIINIIEQATEKEWQASIEKNNGIITPYLKRKLLTQEQITAYTSKNLDALKAFQQRKTDGLSLSDRIWKYTNQFKSELEMGLDLGLREGKSAQQISRDIRKYLNEPNLLFRKVRDKRGNLHLSKQAQKMKVGQGVYRSSYKNAMRVARTEVNMAYRASDLEKYRQLDFVIGYEVKRSNHLYGCPVCEALQGKYPKDFYFVGWHPQCRCYTIPILNKLDDFIEQQKAILEGKNYTPTLQIQDVPNNFKQWATDNQERMHSAQSVPYWWRENQQYVNEDLRNAVYDLMQKAKNSKSELLAIVTDLSKLYYGKTTDINFKSEKSIFRKITKELNADVSQIKDSIRTTIILSDKKYNELLHNLKNITIFARYKIQSPDDFAGYSGILTNIKMKKGIFAEIQFNTDKMIYAKEKPTDAIRMIGKKRWEEIKKETGKDGGLGHLFYEEMRLLEKGSPKYLELKKKSEDYYSKFR